MLDHALAAVFSSVARGTGAENSPDQRTQDHRGIRLFLNITAASGVAPTLDIKLQVKDEVSGVYLDLTGASFAQQSTTGALDLVVYPGITSTANRRVSDVIPRTWRAVATVAGTTPSFTFSLTGDYVP